VKPLTKPKKDTEFNEVLVEAIDEALMALGEKAKASLYMHLQTNFGLTKKEYSDRVSEFTDALEKIFGQGALQLQLLIMKCLNEKVGGSYEWSGPKWLVPDLTFTKYVKLMRIYYEDTNNVTDLEVMLDAGEQAEQKV
jgi:hypothetical protein